MLWGCWCAFLLIPSFFTVCWLRSATEQPVSNSTWIWCFFSLMCSIIVIIGRVPLGTVLGLLDGVPALGSSFLRFLDSPHIIVEVLGRGCSRPLKNPIWNPPIVVTRCSYPWFPPRLLFAAWSPRVLPPLHLASFSLPIPLLPSRGLWQ